MDVAGTETARFEGDLTADDDVEGVAEVAPAGEVVPRGRRSVARCASRPASSAAVRPEKSGSGRSRRARGIGRRAPHDGALPAASHVAALEQAARTMGLCVAGERQYIDDGVRGSRLDRPGLDALGGAAADGS